MATGCCKNGFKQPSRCQPRRSHADHHRNRPTERGGFSTPCPLDRGADIAAFGYVTQAANTRAFIAALAGIVPDGLPPRRGQFLRALEMTLPGSAATLFGAVPSDPADLDHLAYWHTIGVVPS